MLICLIFSSEIDNFGKFMGVDRFGKNKIFFRQRIKRIFFWRKIMLYFFFSRKWKKKIPLISLTHSFFQDILLKVIFPGKKKIRHLWLSIYENSVSYRALFLLPRLEPIFLVPRNMSLSYLAT